MSQKFHGITLANNSTADNFHFERLASDPTPLSAGRVWFNTTEKAFKYSGLNAGGAVTVNVFSSAAEALASIATIQTSLNTEITNRGTSEAAITASVTAETTARVAADAVVASNAADAVNTESTSRLAGDTALGGRVDAVQAELDATQAAVGLNVNGTYAAPANTTYLGAASSVKGSTVLLDKAISDEVTARGTKDAAQDAALAAEAQSRADADANLQTQLTNYINAAVTNNTNADNAETLRATTAESAIKTELDLTQATIGTAADGSLVPYTGTNYLNAVTTLVTATKVLDTQVFAANTAIAAENTARTAANVSFNTSLQTEITARTAADTAIQLEVDNIEVGTGLETNGLYASPTGSNYLGAAVNLKDADTILDSAIKVVSDKTNSAFASATVNTTNLSTEVARALAAEEKLTTDLSTEITDRAVAVAAEATRAQAAETALQTSINNLVAASGDGSVALKTTLNAGRFTFTASTAALEHVITHNLNTSYYLADIKVLGDDGVYRNDICPVEEINANSFRVSLTEARKVKVGVLSLAAIV